MTLESLESLSSWTGWASVILTVITALLGAAYFHFSGRVSAVRAERAAAVEKAQGPRHLDMSAFRDALKNKPSCDVEILYQPGDTEAHNLAMQIYQGLLGSSWKPLNPLKPFPRPIPTTAARADLKKLPRDLLQAIPPTLRLTPSAFGVSVMGNKSAGEIDTLKRALADAIYAGGLSVMEGVISEMPDNLLLIVVGPKP